MSTSRNARDSLAALLRERSASVRECERKAASALDGDGGKAAHRELMREKALLLASLSSDAALLAAGLSGPEREQLEEFSRSAKTALRLDSVFYMSALLYPDDHREGEQNNLERFISTFF